ncbi:SAM-dependent methyltransferase [Actinoplanes sp. NPDC049265]|uniref:SAM-dependent methyltransferase n=1 Tax=Actinoplanes sp. NPDC049265 TaxID=3363902 RepID=UPI003713FF30
MTPKPDWVPGSVDITVPHAARIYDYALGGDHHFEVDREFWERAKKLMPSAELLARANRAYLGRVVRWLAGAGVDQFLDIGSGIPTIGNVHAVAQEANPEARVMYVDIDPIAVEQSRSLLRGDPRAGVIEGDLRRPESILFHPEVLELLDFGRPVAVLTVAVWHFVPDAAQPAEIVATIGDALVRGSYLALSHLGPDPTPEGRAEQARAVRLYESTPTPVTVRSADEVAALFGAAFEILGPGVAAVTDWFPDPEDADDPPAPSALAAVGRRR